MEWSNWRGASVRGAAVRGAVVMMLALVGPAWSQAAAPTSSSGERLMTVHENGKGLRCRLICNWRMPDGVKAYQVQVVDTGEMMTIVEDGPATVINEPLLYGKVKSMPMRIYHWGASRVPPPGVPTKPALANSPAPASPSPASASPAKLAPASPARANLAPVAPGPIVPVSAEIPIVPVKTTPPL